MIAKTKFYKVLKHGVKCKMHFFQTSYKLRLANVLANSFPAIPKKAGNSTEKYKRNQLYKALMRNLNVNIFL